MAADLIQALPKVELHCHSDGAVDPEMLRSLGGEERDFDELAAALEGAYPISSLERWATAYAPIIDKFLGPISARLPVVILAQAARWRRQNVQYAELFVSRALGGIADQGAMLEWFRMVRAQLDALAGNPRISLVVCVGRGSREKLAAQTPRILALARAGLVTGVALAGDELACPVRALEHFFAEFHAHGLGIEIHAGETGGPDSVRDALDFGRPHRLGHGVRAFEDPALVDRLVRERVHLEFCPTSNVRLGVVRAYEQLPIRAALRAGLEFSINTDDPGVFECSLTSELQTVTESFQLTPSELEKIFSWSLRAAFDNRGGTGDGV
jgi:adenosine deaminase